MRRNKGLAIWQLLFFFYSKIGFCRFPQTPCSARPLSPIFRGREKNLNYFVDNRRIVCYCSAGANTGNQPKHQNKNMNSDQYIAPWEDNGKDEIPAEWGAVRGTEGLNCGSDENDGIMALLKEYGF